MIEGRMIEGRIIEVLLYYYMHYTTGTDPYVTKNNYIMV